MNDILAVVDWIEHMLISSFFNPSQPCRAGLRIHNECCPASSLLRPTQLTLYVELLGAFLCVGAPPQLALGKLILLVSLCCPYIEWLMVRLVWLYVMIANMAYMVLYMVITMYIGLVLLVPMMSMNPLEMK